MARVVFTQCVRKAIPLTLLLLFLREVGKKNKEKDGYCVPKGPSTSWEGV